MRAWSLIRKLKSHMPCGQKMKTENRKCNKFNKDLKKRMKPNINYRSWVKTLFFWPHLTAWGGEGNGTPLQYFCLENPWTEEPGRLQSMGLLRVGNNWATSLSLFTFMPWRRKWQPTPVFLPGESQGRGSLVGCHLWGRRESDTTEAT